MKNPKIKTAFLTAVMLIAFVCCKKKDPTPQDTSQNPAPTPAAAPDYRDKFLGDYAVTFTTYATPQVLETKTVTVRKPFAGEITPNAIFVDSTTWVMLVNVTPFTQLPLVIDTLGKTNYGIIVNIGGGKFNSQWMTTGGSKAELVLGSGIKLP